MNNYKSTMKEINDLLQNYSESSEISKYSLHENRSTIDLDLNQQKIYQEYSGNRILNSDIFEFIDKAYSYTKKNSEIRLRIIFPEDMSQKEKESIKKMIQVHYAIQLKETNLIILRTNIKGTISLIIGAILFAIFGLLEWYNVNFIFQGIIEIFSWVFIWEACDSYAFTNSSNRMKRIRYYHLYHASQKL